MRYLRLFFVMMVSVLPFTASALDLSELSDAERKAFRQEVRDYLLENPGVLMEAMSVLEQRQEQAEEAADNLLVSQFLPQLTDDGFSFVGGNPEGDITIVEFLDYRCSYCRKAHAELTTLLQEDGNIRWVVKEYPILGEESVKSSQLAVATLQSLGPKAYLDMHNALMDFSAPITEASIRHLAGTIGVDAEVLLAAITSEPVKTHLDKTRDLGEQMQVSGTPTFIVGSQVIRGYVPGSAMRELVQQQRVLAN